MQDSLKQKLIVLNVRYQEIGGLLSDSRVINDQNRYRELSKEYAQLEPIAHAFAVYNENTTAIQAAEEMRDDPDLKVLAEEELCALNQKKEAIEQELKMLLLPKDPNDGRDVFLEVRAGTGGDEAAIFAGDLYRMYARYAERCGWQISMVSCSDAEQGGYKEIVAEIKGKNVYSQLKFESGAHRVQRVPVTESQGRVHTSACTVAVLPEIDAVESIDINPADLRIDTYRASGAGGQHVNRTESAVRITHLPTGTVVECQDERSQHKNKARAMSLLTSRILAKEQQKQHSEQAATRKLLVGSGDRSERIRTYNYPQGRVTDHRINLTLYKLEEIMNGDLSVVVDRLTRELQAEQLIELSNEN